MGHSVGVNWLILVMDPTADTPYLHRDLAGELVLNGQVEGVNRVRPEMWVQSFARSG